MGREAGVHELLTGAGQPVLGQLAGTSILPFGTCPVAFAIGFAKWAMSKNARCKETVGARLGGEMEKSSVSA